MLGIIIAAMPEKELYIPPDSFIIAADKGYQHAVEAGICPNLVVGDFDSLGYVPSAPQLLQYPAEKDYSDTLLALEEGLSRGVRSFLIYGGIGGRLDHTISNIQTLAFLRDRGAEGLLYADNIACMLLHNGEVRFPAHMRGTISVFCFGDMAQGVTESGLRYCVTDYTMRNALPIGLSNEFIGQESVVGVRNGTLLLLWQTDVRRAISMLGQEG